MASVWILTFKQIFPKHEVSFLEKLLNVVLHGSKVGFPSFTHVSCDRTSQSAPESIKALVVVRPLGFVSVYVFACLFYVFVQPLVLFLPVRLELEPF